MIKLHTSVRLNKDLRGQIVNNIMEKYKVNNVRPDSGKVVAAATDKLIAAYYESNLPAFSTTIAPYLRMITSLYVRVPNGSYRYVYFDTARSKVLPSLGGEGAAFDFINEVAHSKPVNQALFDTLCEQVTLAYSKVQEADKQVNIYAEAYNAYRSEVSTVIDSVTTTGKLLDLWAAVEPFLPQGIQNPSKIQLPAISLDTLNKGIK